MAKKKQQKKERLLPLRLEIALDGKNAGLYQGQLLVYGLRWHSVKKFYEILPLNENWEAALINKEFQQYLSEVIQVLEDYRKEAQKLINMRDALEYIYRDK